MNAPPRWSTSSYGESPETKPAELEALRQHLTQCRATDGRVAALLCGWLRVQAFVASRLVTTLLLLALGFAASAFIGF